MVTTTRDRILDEAAKLFTERGYEATSVQDIALALGLVVAANGEAVGALAEAGVLHERTVSAPATMVERIEAAGARWSESPATAEGRVVTGRGEGAVAAFVKAVLREIQQVIRTAEGGGGE